MKSRRDTQLNQLAVAFFQEFARTEYALKASGWIRAGRNDDAHPDWDRFAREVGDRVLATLRHRGSYAADYILNHPPRKQVVRNGQLEWADSPLLDRTDKERLLLLVRRIRNNLFHGGKFNGRWFQPERSHELISNGLDILHACRQSDPRLLEAYES